MESKEGFKKTEQFALEEEEREMRWQQQYAVQLPAVIVRIDKLLKTGLSQDRWKVHEMFLDMKFFEKYKQTDVLATMRIIMQVYEKEMEVREQHTILDQGNSVEELIEFIRKLRFIWYRFDFEIGEQTEKELISFIGEHKLSTNAVEMALIYMSMRPLTVAWRLVSLFEKNEMYLYQFSILRTMETYWPGNYRVWKELEQIYGKIGHLEEGKQYQDKIQERFRGITDNTEAIGEVFQLLWRLNYNQAEKGGGVTDVLKKYPLRREEWMKVLENNFIGTPNFYLFLSEYMSGAGLREYALLPLQYGENRYPGDGVLELALAEAYIRENKWKQAVECLEQIENPEKEIEKILKACKTRIGGI